MPVVLTTKILPSSQMERGVSQLLGTKEPGRDALQVVLAAKLETVRWTFETWNILKLETTVSFLELKEISLNVSLIGITIVWNPLFWKLRKVGVG